MPELDIEKLIEEATPREAKVSVCLKGDLDFRHRELKRQLVNGSAPTERKRLADEIGQIEQEMAAAQATFLFRQVSHEKWDEIRKPYLFGALGIIDPDKLSAFAPVAMAASAVDPEITEDQARRLFAKINAGQRDVLLDAALLVNIGVVDVPFSPAASKIRGRPASSRNSKRRAN